MLTQREQEDAQDRHAAEEQRASNDARYYDGPIPHHSCGRVIPWLVFSDNCDRCGLPWFPATKEKNRYCRCGNVLYSDEEEVCRPCKSTFASVAGWELRRQKRLMGEDT